MPQIIWSEGDFFTCANARPRGRGYGVVLADSQSVVISGGGGRMGWFISRKPIPADASPDDFSGVDFAVRMALVTVTVAVGLHKNPQHVI